MTRAAAAMLLVLAGCAAGPQAPLERPSQVSERDWTECGAELDAARARSWDLAPLSGLPGEMSTAGLAMLAVAGIDRTTDPVTRWNHAMLACLSRRARSRGSRGRAVPAPRRRPGDRTSRTGRTGWGGGPPGSVSEGRSGTRRGRGSPAR